jgi:peptide-methionine (S)-S-oxide reductase
MPFTIREATSADIPALAALHVQTWNATYPDVPVKPTCEIRERQWREAFAVTDGSWFCFVIESQNGEMVGFAKGIPYNHPDLPDFSGELSKIYLLREHQRQGLGRRLVGHVARRFLSQGITSMVLFAEPSNPSCAFYEALGAERLLDAIGHFHGGYGWRALHWLASVCPVEGIEGALVMDQPQRLDSLFREAVSAIDAGDVPALEGLLGAHPILVRARLDTPGDWLRDTVGDALEGFFRQPYLLWFVAEDPVRNGKLPGNIAQVTRTILQAAQRERVDSLQEQLDYALRLVSWSWIARECAVQRALIDVLADAGASVAGNPDNALVNGNFAAAAHLVERGAPLTLATALCLGRWEDAGLLATTASAGEKQFGFILAALNGQAEAVRRIIALGVDLNAPSADLYAHATALHHAVSSGSLDTVKALVEAGADLGVQDTAYHGTPSGWAEYYQGQPGGEERRGQYAGIAAYLREQAGQPCRGRTGKK